MRVVWPALPRSIFAPLLRDVASSPREALSALFEAVSPDLPVRLEEPEASVNRHQIYDNRMRRRYRAFRDAHGYKPWKYYHGRDRWTELPPEFRYRG